MEETQIINLIGTLGFPIAVCIYLLLERGKTTKELIIAIRDLTLMVKLKLKK